MARNTERALFSDLAQFLARANPRSPRPVLARAFAEIARADLALALANPILLHGRRVQSMFEAMVVAFDRHLLIKTEDAGEIHSRESFACPGFRIVQKSDEQVLIGVKIGMTEVVRRRHL